MNYLHQTLDVSPDDMIEVILDHAANVQLLDAANFNAYQSGRENRYIGGHATTSPVNLRVPTSGLWHLVIDLGGMAGSVRADARVISRMAS